MLSAQKQQMPSDTLPESSTAPTATGFGKVLNSIQGLQQRLDDFSIEEVTRAHAKTQTLIRELENLQAQLNALAKLKDVAFSVNTQVAAIPPDKFELVEPDSLENHPQLRAILQADKLIRMHRALKPVQPIADASGSDFRATIPSNDAGSNQGEPGSHASYPTEQISQTLAVDARIDNTEKASESSQPTELPENSLVVDRAAPKYDFADLKLEETLEAVAFRENHSSQPASRAQSDSSRKNKKTKGKAQIDQRLLSDLIETYGEFAVSANPAVRAEAIAIPPPAVESGVSTSTDLVPVGTQPVKPAILPPEPSSNPRELPEPAQERKDHVFDAPSPSLRSQGELDRQLKSIIKDYGEFDLYPRRKTINVKNTVIAAVAGLALVLGGFYLFKAPSSPAPSAVETTAAGADTSSNTGEQPARGKQNLR